MTATMGSESGVTWEEAVAAHRATVEKDLPEALRPYLLGRIDRLDEAFPRDADLSPDDIDGRVFELNDAVPSPLAIGSPGASVQALRECVVVLIGEIIDLKDRIAALEAT